MRDSKEAQDGMGARVDWSMTVVDDFRICCDLRQQTQWSTLGFSQGPLALLGILNQVCVRLALAGAKLLLEVRPGGDEGDIDEALADSSGVDDLEVACDVDDVDLRQAIMEWARQALARARDSDGNGVWRPPKNVRVQRAEAIESCLTYR